MNVSQTCRLLIWSSHVKDHQQNQHTELPSALTIFSLGFDWYSDIAGANYFVKLTGWLSGFRLLSFTVTSILEIKTEIGYLIIHNMSGLWGVGGSHQQSTDFNCVTGRRWSRSKVVWIREIGLFYVNRGPAWHRTERISTFPLAKCSLCKYSIRHEEKIDWWQFQVFFYEYLFGKSNEH